MTPRTLRTSALLVAMLLAGSLEAADPLSPRTDVQIVVMDPLALPLSCACVDGVGQRQYDSLVPLLQERFGRPVRLTHDESLRLAAERIGRTPDVVIGPRSIVLFDANRLAVEYESVLSLTNRDGRTTVRGTLLGRSSDGELTLAGLGGKRIALGPVEHEECHAAVWRLFEDEQLADRVTVTEYTSIEAAVFAVTDREADAAAVTDYLPPLLEGCGKIAPGELRPLARTEPVPFIEVFVRADVAPELTGPLVAALSRPGLEGQAVLDVIESQRGFVSTDRGWTDWRGANRAGRFEALPRTLPSAPAVRWLAAATGPAMAGVAATADFVLIPDKDADLTMDVFRCLDARTGRTLWRREFPADDDIDYTNAPRATPVLSAGLAYLQGAGGELHCVEATSGETVWQRHLLHDFAAEPLPWGCSIAPLLVEDRLIVTPGAAEAAVVALDRRTGAVLWETPGHAAAYSALIVGEFGGRRQLVGYDAAGLAGWDVETGRRLWELVPPSAADFNVTTPVNLDGRLLLATENNGTRLYSFRDDGRINPKPVASNEDCAPDTCTPVVEQGRVFCAAYGEMFCLDVASGLKTIWKHRDDKFFDHTNLIAGNGRVLAWTIGGDLLLIDAEADVLRIISSQQPFSTEENVETMSHPALVGHQIYLRCRTKIGCFDFK